MEDLSAGAGAQARAKLLLRRLSIDLAPEEGRLSDHLCYLSLGVEPDLTDYALPDLQDLAEGCFSLTLFLTHTDASELECGAAERMLALSMVNDECVRLRVRALEREVQIPPRTAH